MSVKEQFPITSDFDFWPVKTQPKVDQVDESPFALTWSDGATRRYHPLMLAKNDPSSATLHPMSRDTTLSPLELPDDLIVVEAHIKNNRTIPVQGSHGGQARRYYPDGLATEVSRTAVALPEPLTFDGSRALVQPKTFLDWLIASRDYGFARLENLLSYDGLLLRLVAKTG